MIEFGKFIDKLWTYDEAWLYAATLFYNNKSDWRLPTADEYFNAPELVSYFQCWSTGHSNQKTKLNTIIVRTI